MAERRFRYRWDRTWPDKSEDFIANDGDISIGRVYRITSISTGGWFWTCNGRIGKYHGSNSGHVLTRDEACEAVEQAWDEMKAVDKKADSGSRS